MVINCASFFLPFTSFGLKSRSLGVTSALLALSLRPATGMRKTADYPGAGGRRVARSQHLSKPVIIHLLI